MCEKDISQVHDSESGNSSCIQIQGLYKKVVGYRYIRSSRQRDRWRISRDHVKNNGILFQGVWHQHHARFPGQGSVENIIVISELGQHESTELVALFCGVSGMRVICILDRNGSISFYQRYCCLCMGVWPSPQNRIQFVLT